MQHYFPGDPNFQRENYWQLPVFLILEAIREGAKLQREDRHAREIGVAILTAYTVNANRSSESSLPPAQAKDYFFFEPLESELEIGNEAANCFFSIAEDRYLPPWALDKVGDKISELEKLKDPRVPIPKVRAFQGKGILLLAPSIINGKVESNFAIFENPEEIIEIWNVDDRPPKARRSFIPKKRFPIKCDMPSDFEGYCFGVSLEIV